jgi:uncharacterized membrane protein (DUF441 family)
VLQIAEAPMFDNDFVVGMRLQKAGNLEVFFESVLCSVAIPAVQDFLGPRFFLVFQNQKVCPLGLVLLVVGILLPVLDGVVYADLVGTAYIVLVFGAYEAVLEAVGLLVLKSPVFLPVIIPSAEPLVRS